MFQESIPAVEVAATTTRELGRTATVVAITTSVNRVTASPTRIPRGFIATTYEVIDTTTIEDAPALEAIAFTTAVFRTASGVIATTIDATVTSAGVIALTDLVIFLTVTPAPTTVAVGPLTTAAIAATHPQPQSTRSLHLATAFPIGDGHVPTHKRREVIMATAKKPTATSYVTKLQTMIAGLTTSVPTALKSMIIGGSSLTIAQVITQLQTFLGLFNTVTNTHQAWRAAVAAKTAGLVAGRALYAGVVVMLKQYFGTNQAALAAFGITVPAPRAKATSTTKAIAHAKALATRAARNTKGSKQRTAIKATPQPSMAVTLPGVGSGTPGGAAPAPAAAAAPAPAPAEAPAAAPAAPNAVVPNPAH